MVYQYKNDKSAGWIAEGDCIEGMMGLPSESVDLVFADPPFGINFDRKGNEYKRDNSLVVDGYEEVAPEDYEMFSDMWIRRAMRLLKPSGALWVMSGWTHSHHVHRAILAAGLELVNKLIWNYNFGVYTQHKFVSCFYEMFYAVKPPVKGKVFNRLFEDRKEDYHDRQAVWRINREYRPGEVKNATKLPQVLVEKVVRHTTNPGQLVLDPFLGNGTTVFACLELGRNAVGWELNQAAYEAMERRLRIAVGDEVPD